MQAKYRIAYFTEKNDSILMWAHYGNHLKGYCLELNTRKDPEFFKGIRKVEYSGKRYEKIDEGLYFQKFTDWEYECEWRIAYNPATISKWEENDDGYLPTKAISGIIIGERAFYKGPLSRIVKQKNMDCYIATSDEKEYKINIERL